MDCREPLRPVIFNSLLRGRAMKRTIVLFAFLASCLALASQIPAPGAGEQNKHPQTKSQGGENGSNADQRGTESSPLVVKVVLPHDTNPATKSNPQEQDNEPPHEWWVIVPTIALALFTLVLAIYTWKLWGTTKRVAQEAKNSSERQLRAYVEAPTGNPLLREWLNGILPVVQVNFRNVGETPAYDMTSALRLEVLDFPYTGTFGPPEQTRGGPAVVNPGQGRFISCATDQPVSNAVRQDIERTAVEAGSKALYLWGWVHFLDAFGKRQSVNFRLCFRGQFVRAAPWIYCDEGNDAT